MKRLMILVALLALVGCQEKQLNEMSYAEVKALSLEIHKRCWAQGVKDGSPEMKMCINQELNREMSMRRNNTMKRQAFAQALGDMGDQMQANARNQAMVNAMNRPINCTSTRGMNGTINTNCY